ncbi:hypothetical protein RRG08_027616 [Elysia crispata]|uniref:Uncharacterized protein n=1 Tax=Elysia crispata TaxID=231223 RepID=A0AAE1DY73_9GAST|nr:hypothetical protein RRG08_027616 [Elysia crispata]
MQIGYTHDLKCFNQETGPLFILKEMNPEDFINIEETTRIHLLYLSPFTPGIGLARASNSALNSLVAPAVPVSTQPAVGLLTSTWHVHSTLSCIVCPRIDGQQVSKRSRTALFL